jgi:ribonuclease BN (tRNA processing enzyme)
MKLVVLGSGSAVPHPARSSSGYWLETAKGSILLDCSASAIHRMAEERLDWAKLDAIWISHFHLDHAGGLAPFLFGTRNAPQMKEREKPLKIFGAKGLKRLIDAFDKVNDYKLFKQPFPVEIIEVEPLEKFEILPETTADALKTPHTGESLSIRIKHDDKTLVYSGDTGFEKIFRTFAKRADLLILECSFFKNKTTEKHLELSEAMFIIRHAKPKKAVLTHFYADWDDVDFQKEVAKFSPACEVIQAHDGLTFNI